MDPDQTDQDPRCLAVCKNRFEKIARIFSRRHKQTTFSDAGFLGILRVKKNTAEGSQNEMLKILLLLFKHYENMPIQIY